MEAPADVSLSIVDLSTGHGWRRQPATVQIEGGSYSLIGVRQLRDILDGFLASVAQARIGPLGG